MEKKKKKKEIEAFQGVFSLEHVQKLEVKSRTRTRCRPQI